MPGYCGTKLPVELALLRQSPKVDLEFTPTEVPVPHVPLVPGLLLLLALLL